MVVAVIQEVLEYLESEELVPTVKKIITFHQIQIEFHLSIERSGRSKIVDRS